MRIYGLIVLFIILIGCKKKPTPSIEPIAILVPEPIKHSLDTVRVVTPTQRSYQHLLEILPSESIVIDMPYATTDNFTDSVIYDCEACFVSDTLHKRLQQAAMHLYTKYRFRIKLFDCYRPLPAQQKLWSIFPNATYVTNPNKGSMHNRGMAVDLTLVDSLGIELDMGSAFDHFGREAHIDNYNHSKSVLSNRTILTETMRSFGFKGIRTEWWHYSMRSPFYPILSWEWSCE